METVTPTNDSQSLSLSYDFEGTMLGKATSGRKHLQMLSDITSKHYVILKRSAEDKQLAEEFVPNLPFRQKTEEEKNLLHVCNQ